MLSIFFGMITVALGFWALWFWRMEFILFLKGMVPVSMIFTGFIAILMGASNKSEDTSPSKKNHGRA